MMLFIFGLTFLLYPSIVFQGNLTLYDAPQWNFFMYNLFFSLGDFSGRTLGRIKHYYSRALYVIGGFARVLLVSSTFIIAYKHDS